MEEYLDHNELGLAFATLVESLVESAGLPPQEVMACLRSAYDRMERPSDGGDAWRRLQDRNRF